MRGVLVTDTTTDIRQLKRQFILHCAAAGMSPQTMPARISRLRQFADFCEANGVNLDNLNNVFMDYFYLEYGKNHKKSTVNASKRVLKVFLRWLEDYKEMQLRVRVEAIKNTREPKQLPKALSREVILQAIAAAPGPYDAAMIETCWRAGLRIGELVRLRERDVRGDELFIQGKGAVERTVYITDGLARKLEALKRGESDTPIFRNRKDHYRPIGIKPARLHIQRVFQRIGVEMTPHQLRHSFAVELLTKGCDIVTIQTLMGHEDITTTQVYLRLFDDQVKSQYKKFMV